MVHLNQHDKHSDPISHPRASDLLPYCSKGGDKLDMEKGGGW